MVPVGQVYLQPISYEISNLGTYPYSTEFFNESISAMDGRVASLLGHESSENIFFAYGNDQRSTLMSKDEGITWYNVPRDFYLDTRSKLTFIPSKNIPMQVTNLAVSEPHASYQFGNWGGL